MKIEKISKSKVLKLAEETDYLVWQGCGINYLQKILNLYGRKIEIINEVDTDKEDLIQDFISIITSFCSRIYGQRRSKRKTEKIINEINKE